MDLRRPSLEGRLRQPPVNNPPQKRFVVAHGDKPESLHHFLDKVLLMHPTQSILARALLSFGVTSWWGLVHGVRPHEWESLTFPIDSSPRATHLPVPDLVKRILQSLPGFVCYREETGRRVNPFNCMALSHHDFMEYIQSSYRNWRLPHGIQFSGAEFLAYEDPIDATTLSDTSKIETTTYLSTSVTRNVTKSVGLLGPIQD